MLLVVANSRPLALWVFRIFEDIVDDGRFLGFIIAPRCLTMDFVQMWTSIGQIIARCQSVKLGFRIALKHVFDLNVLEQLVMSLLGFSHDGEGLT